MPFSSSAHRAATVASGAVARAAACSPTSHRSSAITGVGRRDRSATPPLTKGPRTCGLLQCSLERARPRPLERCAWRRHDLPGRVAERLHPRCIRDLSADVGHGAIVITGTNGKTTTAKMLGDTSATAGTASSATTRAPTCGAASPRRSSPPRASCAASTATSRFWRSTRQRSPAWCPGHRSPTRLVTNLSRDQLDRYGDLDTLTDAHRRHARSGSRAHACSTRTTRSSPGSQAWSRGRSATSGWTAGASRAMGSGGQRGAPCPKCATPVEWSRTYYGHLGAWTLSPLRRERPDAGLRGPRCAARADVVRLHGWTRVTSASTCDAAARGHAQRLQRDWRRPRARLWPGARRRRTAPALARFRRPSGARRSCGRGQRRRPAAREEPGRSRAGARHRSCGRRRRPGRSRAQRQRRGRHGRLLDLGRRLRGRSTSDGARSLPADAARRTSRCDSSTRAWRESGQLFRRPCRGGHDCSQMRRRHRPHYVVATYTAMLAIRNAFMRRATASPAGVGLGNSG